MEIKERNSIILQHGSSGDYFKLVALTLRFKNLSQELNHTLSAICLLVSH